MSETSRYESGISSVKTRNKSSGTSVVGKVGDGVCVRDIRSRVRTGVPQEGSTTSGVLPGTPGE